MVGLTHSSVLPWKKTKYQNRENYTYPKKYNMYDMVEELI